MKTSSALLSFLLFAAGGAMPQGVPQFSGAIYGVVVDENNQPAKAISITVAGSGQSPNRRIPALITDGNGRYRIANLVASGKYAIYAEDWDAGYSTFVNSEVHEATISLEHPEAELNFRLPPPAGFLDFHLTNRKTGEEIRDLVINVRVAGKDNENVRSISQSTDRPVLVLPDRDLLIHVTAHGFQEWNQSVGNGLAIRVKSGTHMKLNVQLDRSPR